MKIGKLDRYFLTQDAPLGKIRRFDLAKIKGLLISIGALGLILILMIPTPEKRSQATATSVNETTSIAVNPYSTRAQGAESGQFYVSNVSAYATSGSIGSRQNRQLTASQLVKQQGSGLSFGLASGTNVPMKMLNRIVTSDSRNPVIAVVMQDATSPSGFTLPSGTKVLGNAQADAGSDRVQIAFHTLVFEDGTERPFTAIATMSDGSSGVVGDLHSQLLKKEGGKFLSKFVGGFADGFKDRERGTILPFEPGNLKNAALNGISESASDQAKSYEEESKNIRPFITVDSGTNFVMFLEKGLGF